MATTKKERWKRKQARVRKKIRGSTERPRLCVSKSNRYLIAQIIDDQKGCTLASANSQELDLDSGKNVEAARALGALIAKRAKEHSVSQVVLDRNGYIYWGRVKAVAEAAREGGLLF